MSELQSSLGNIYITHRAIATIAAQSALESYGIVGMAPKTIFKGISNLLLKDPTTGVEVSFDGQSIKVNLYIIVEYGTRIKSVAKSVSNSVRYQIEKAIEIPVSEVNTHVRGLRISNPD
jgi:uncharacterized alkaline shock family protein YloU